MINQLTLKDISIELGVSISTVSKALKDSYEIGSATRLRIQKYAKENNYQPNSMALNLLKRKTQSIGVILPDLKNNLYPKLITGIENEISIKGYKLIIGLSHGSCKKERELIGQLKCGSIDGLILVSSEESVSIANCDKNYFNEILGTHLPIIIIDRFNCPNIKYDRITSNDFEVTFNAVSHLANTGCIRIGLIQNFKSTQIKVLRTRAFKKALKESDMFFNENLIFNLTRIDRSFHSFKKFIINNKIDGLVCLNEFSIIKVLKYLNRMSISVPDKISVIGCSNGNISKIIEPKITTVSQNGKQLGRLAVKLLFKRIEKNRESAKIKKSICPVLTQRESTHII